MRRAHAPRAATMRLVRRNRWLFVRNIGIRISNITVYNATFDENVPLVPSFRTTVNPTNRVATFATPRIPAFV